MIITKIRLMNLYFLLWKRWPKLKYALRYYILKSFLPWTFLMTLVLTVKIILKTMLTFLGLYNTLAVRSIFLICFSTLNIGRYFWKHFTLNGKRKKEVGWALLHLLQSTVTAISLFIKLHYGGHYALDYGLYGTGLHWVCSKESSYQVVKTIKAVLRT